MSDNPLGGFLGDILNVLNQQGPDAWFETARSLATTVARGEDGDPNPDPAERQRFEQFAPLVARHVAALFEVGVEPTVTAITRTGLTLAVLEQWRPLVGPLVTAAPVDLGELDGMPAGLPQLFATIGPLFTGFQLGSVAGHFSERAWSPSALALPRQDRTALVVVDNVRRFATEWSLDEDRTAVFALARELVGVTILSQPGTADALAALLLDAMRDTVAAQGDLLGRLGQLGGPEELAALMGDPARLLDGIEVPDDTPATIAANAAVAVVSAVIDACATSITEQLFGPVGALREAYHRYQLADAKGEEAAAALFGLSTRGEPHPTAAQFVATIAHAHGLRAFTGLLRADGLPRPQELAAPDEWVDRLAQSPLA